jgi:hypothetical protein
MAVKKANLKKQPHGKSYLPSKQKIPDWLKAEDQLIDVPEAEHGLDPELMDFDNVPCDDTDSNSLSSEDEDHDEIVELSELEKFSATLKEAQRVALEVQRAKTTTRGPYTGGSQTTQYLSPAGDTTLRRPEASAL